MRDLRLILNVLWIVCGGGLPIALEYAFGGLILCMTVVGVPFGLQCFKLAHLSLLPFGKDVVHDPESAGGGALGLVLNILWVVVAGFWIFLSHVGVGVVLACTVIGIPFALQHLKLAVLAFVPFGRKIVELPA